MLASKYSEHVCNWTVHELSEVCNVDSEQVTIGNEVHHTHWKYNLLALRKQPWIQGNMGNISALQHILQFRVFLFGLLLTLFHCCLNQGYFEVFLGLFLGYTLTIGLFHTYFQRGEVAYMAFRGSRNPHFLSRLGGGCWTFEKPWISLNWGNFSLNPFTTISSSMVFQSNISKLPKKCFQSDLEAFLATIFKHAYSYP